MDQNTAREESSGEGYDLFRDSASALVNGATKDFELSPNMRGLTASASANGIHPPLITKTEGGLTPNGDVLNDTPNGHATRPKRNSNRTSTGGDKAAKKRRVSEPVDDDGSRFHCRRSTRHLEDVEADTSLQVVPSSQTSERDEWDVSVNECERCDGV